MAKRIWMLGALAAFALTAGAEPPKLASVFSDYMVIQRDAPVTVFGTADAGKAVTVTFDNESRTVRASRDGRWSADFPAIEAGGSHVISLLADGTPLRTLAEIAGGDVFLCSGQSNMEWPVSAAIYGAGEVASAENPNIRLLAVSQVGATSPQVSLPEGDRWKVSSPESAAGFSAICYFTGRAIEKEYGVPVGLIDSSWGGSRIEPWISEASLAADGTNGDALAILKRYREDPPAGLALYAKQWTDWWRSHEDFDDREPWTGDTSLDWQPTPDYRVSDWQTWGVPELADFHGLVWHRMSFTLTPEQAASAATAHLGGMDDVDVAWLNGTAIGATYGWGTPRVYDVPPGTLRAGENVVVVNVDNTWGPGGMTGPDEEMYLSLADGSTVSLAQGWTWLKVPPEAGRPKPAPWFPIQGYSILYNSMIAPLGSIRLKGALWYQGESNAGEGEAYESLLNLLIGDWRAQFGADLPAMVVQLPRYGAPPSAAGTDGWGTIRESMRRVARRDDRTSIVVTIDTGDPLDIHPPNKQEVARRMVRLVRSLVYGEETVGPSGPEVAGVLRAGNVVRVDWMGVEDGLKTISSNQPVGFEACSADGDCQYVTGSVNGAAVMLYLPEGAPADEIRYCQGDAPLCNLFDGNGLPAGPFREPVVTNDQ
ncbi:MAG: sialate O-acetylesterase [Hyphomonas sp.]|uniref:sialate O-acetylesterase n=1 Tax=Hyphomonas sp. TaxID=87 RepID=UPI003527C908